ncbi:hypothetical protein LJC41_01310 [Desulfosarcina sp. OttesenSCG-928-G17]|nr:hypothetical protein [Desulfosarcina sp. OttesenSCG-928-G17]
MKQNLIFSSIFFISILLFNTGIVTNVFAEEANIDDRLKKVEDRLDRQEEQNEKIIELLKNLSQNNSEKEQTISSTKINDKEKFVKGWLAHIYDFPFGFDISDGRIPEVEHGFFRATKSTYQISDFQRELKIDLNSGVLWRCEGILNVVKADRYTFTINIDPTCGNFARAAGLIFVNGKMLSSQAGYCTKFSVVGGAQLNPGRHHVEYIIAPGVSQRNISEGGNNRVVFSLYAKGPLDSSPLPAHEVLLVKTKAN